MKKLEWDNPNKIHMDSGFKTFDQQTNVISTGNVSSNTQFSSFIRPYNEVKNYGYTGKPGDFLKYDMQWFEQIPTKMREIIYDKNRENSCILYEFFIHRNGKREVIGHVLTDGSYKHIASSVNCEYGQSYQKRESAINECKKYICA